MILTARVAIDLTALMSPASPRRSPRGNRGESPQVTLRTGILREDQRLWNTVHACCYFRTVWARGQRTSGLCAMTKHFGHTVLGLLALVQASISNKMIINILQNANGTCNL